MPLDSHPPARTRVLRAAAALAFLGLAFVVGLRLRAPEPLRLAALPVEHAETVVPACGMGHTAGHRLTMLTAYLPREAADAVAGLVVTAGGHAASWSRRNGTCTSGAESEPCPAEACREGLCAIRLPLGDGAGGAIAVELLDRDGRPAGSGSVVAGDGQPPDMPPLDVARSGRTISITGEPEAIARVSVLREGRVAADVPTSLDPGGRARFAVPAGSEAVRVSVSRGGGNGVSQSTAFLPGPFDGACSP